VQSRGEELEHIVPREAYDVDETGYWARMPWATGLMFGATMMVGTVVLLFPRLFRRSMRRLTDRIYQGDPKLINLPATSDGFRYRLPCTWIDGHWGIGGVLCVGAAGVRFVPHKKNMREPATLQLGPIVEIRLELAAPASQNALQRLLIPHPPPLLEIRAAGESVRALVPRPEMTIQALRQAIAGLKGAEKA